MQHTILYAPQQTTDTAVRFLYEKESRVSEIILKMKCKQNLCQRTKNLKTNGNCNVCDDAIEKVGDHRKNDKKKLEHITVDIKQMVDIQNKLSNGIPVDQTVVSGLLLSGIMNILNQHDVIEALEEKLESFQIENKTINTRIESIENWLLKKDEEFKEMTVKLSTTSSRHENVSNPENKNSFEKKCNECGEVLTRNSDFEKHMQEKHDAKKTFECDVCGKMFLLEWRLKKHVDIHKQEPRKCKYFLSKEPCPFADIGCKFSHDDLENEDIETIEDEYSLEENQCHLCRLQLLTKDDLMTHVEVSHEEYFQGAMEYAAANRA